MHHTEQMQLPSWPQQVFLITNIICRTTTIGLLPWDLYDGDMVPMLWCLDYHHGTYTVATWQQPWYLHCGDKTAIMVPTLRWHDYHLCTYTAGTWLPLWYLHCGDMTNIMVPTLWWHDYYIMVPILWWLPLWYLHCNDITTIMVPTLWWVGIWLLAWDHHNHFKVKRWGVEC